MTEESFGFDAAIVDELKQSIATILSVPPASVEPEASVWARFPFGFRQDHPTVEQFYVWFVQRYKVYLTEAEWLNPTLVQLARMVAEKKADPAPMLRNIRIRYRQMKTKLFLFVILAVALVLLCLFAMPMLVTVVLAVFATALALWLWHLESKEFYEEIQPVVEEYKLKLESPEEVKP